MFTTTLRCRYPESHFADEDTEFYWWPPPAWRGREAAAVTDRLLFPEKRAQDKESRTIGQEGVDILLSSEWEQGGLEAPSQRKELGFEKQAGVKEAEIRGDW